MSAQSSESEGPNWPRSPECREAEPLSGLRIASVSFTEAVSQDLLVLAGDATAPSLSDGEVQAVKRTNATSTTPGF